MGGTIYFSELPSPQDLQIRVVCVKSVPFLYLLYNDNLFLWLAIRRRVFYSNLLFPHEVETVVIFALRINVFLLGRLLQSPGYLGTHRDCVLGNGALERISFTECGIVAAETRPHVLTINVFVWLVTFVDGPSTSYGEAFEGRGGLLGAR